VASLVEIGRVPVMSGTLNVRITLSNGYPDWDIQEGVKSLLFGSMVKKLCEEFKNPKKIHTLI
jgi:hypothetical protein